MSRNKNKTDPSYDKYMEHSDNTPLGKLQQQYWTTKQQVMQKLGKKEDEYVVMSDADLDAKLDLFETIEQSSTDLLRVIEIYQDRLINLSIEESEMSRFLKSQSTYDTKTKAGKMMAAVAKAQNFSSQQRVGLRLPLVRLFNEVETYRNRAITDTYLTIRKMENARTEYRGALLWMKNISLELDPDTSKKLEKFRRVQAQVKKTKTKFDRLKVDVQQKIDLLAASRCNMFSHVLVNYQKNLILFWEKTAKTMNAVADAYKGYQYYEFNIIKDLVEPSKKLADMSSSNNKALTSDTDSDNINKRDSELINVNDCSNNGQASTANGLIDFNDPKESNNLEIGKKSYEDEVNELIDLMTLNEASNLNEQLKELEQIELEKKQRTTTTTTNNNNNNKTSANENKNTKKAIDLFALFGNLSSSSSNSGAIKTSDQVMASSPPPADTSSLELDRTSNINLFKNNFKSFNDLISNANDEFEKEWESAFKSSSTTKPANSSSSQAIKSNESPTHDATSEFGMFMSAATSPEPSASTFLFPSQLILADKKNLDNQKADGGEGPLASSSKAIDAKTSKQNWLDLFAELDPLKNPDAVGQKSLEEEERNC